MDTVQTQEHRQQEPAADAATVDDGWRPQLRIALVLLTFALASQLLSALMWLADGRIQLLCFAGGVLLAALLLLPTRRWPAALLGTAAGTLPVLSALGHPVFALLPALLGSWGLIVLSALVLRRTGDRERPFESLRETSRFVAIATVLLPVAGALWLQATVSDDSFAVGRWYHVAAAQALGFLLVVPAVISIADARRQPRPAAASGWKQVALAVLLFALMALAWLAAWEMPDLVPLMTLVPIPLLVWSLIAFRIVGGCACMLAIAVMAMSLSLHGHGPFPATSVDPGLLGVQLWLLAMAVGMLYLGTLVEKRMSSQAGFDRAYRQLGELTRRMLSLQEEERARIARDLHDGVNQSLAAISIQLSALKRSVAGGDRDSVVDLQGQVNEVADAIRELSHELHPSLLRFAGLRGALQAFCNRYRDQREQLQIDCVVGDLPALPAEHELNLFRIVQEAVINVGRHARARQAWVRLLAQDDRLLLVVEDDGCGFAPLPDGRRGPGLGLVSMEERAKLIGAQFSLGARAGGGSRIEVQLPLRSSTERH